MLYRIRQQAHDIHKVLIRALKIDFDTILLFRSIIHYVSMMERSTINTPKLIVIICIRKLKNFVGMSIIVL